MLVILAASCIASYGQLAIGFNTDGNTLCLSTNPENRLWGEFRVNTKAYNQAPWSYSDRGITQVYVLTALFEARDATLYAGGGLGINLLTETTERWLGINAAAGVRINPFEKLPGLYLIGEYVPVFVVMEDVPIIHTLSAGFRFVLRK